MKKGTIFGVAIALGVLAYVAYKSFKKEKAEQKAAEEEVEKREQELDELGVSSSKLDQEIDPEDKEDKDNLVKGLYVGIRFNPKWDEEIISIDRCLNEYNVIHLMQFDPGVLSFTLEIPASVTIEKGHGPKIGDYISTFTQASNKMWADLVKFSPKPSTKLVGYFVLEYTETKDSKESKYGYLRIPEFIYARYADEKFDGLTEYVKRVKSGEIKNIIETEFNDVDFGLSNLYNVKAIDIQLFFRIDFPIQTDNSFGINLKTGLECLRYLTNELVVYRNRDPRNGKGIKYDTIFFHAPNEDGIWDFLYYYDVDGSGKVIVQDYEY